MKKIGQSQQNDEVINKTVEDVINSMTPVSVDSSMSEDAKEFKDTPDDYKGPVFMMDDEPQDPTMTLNDEKLYEGRGLEPANLIKEKEGQEFKDARDIKPKQERLNAKTKKVLDKEIEEANNKRVAKPATELDLENLDESKIMDMPEIRAASFEIITLLDLKPKDKSMRFRWANYKNAVSNNLARYLALGYQIASIDDVDIERTPVHESMIEGGQIKYYDILLLKIPVMRLMALYKSNIIKSVNRLAKSREKGLREANREFMDRLNNEGLGGQYNMAKAKLGGRNPVEFYTPGVEESQLVK